MMANPGGLHPRLRHVVKTMPSNKVRRTSRTVGAAPPMPRRVPKVPTRSVRTRIFL